MEQSDGAGQSIRSQPGAQLPNSPHTMPDPHQNNNTETASLSAQATGVVPWMVTAGPH